MFRIKQDKEKSICVIDLIIEGFKGRSLRIGGRLMINLRQLQEKDAPFMFEWMHDKEIQRNFQRDMFNTNFQDVLAFCKNAEIPEVVQNKQDIHWAVTDETDEYLGTISLKKIDLKNKTAEYAISIRKKAQGKGIAKRATILLLRKAFKEYRLHKVYLNVLPDNKGAIYLYEKCGFKFEGEARECIFKENRYVNLMWYGILENEFAFED